MRRAAITTGGGVNRNVIGLIWLGGLVLAAVLYVAGSEHVLAWFFHAMAQVRWYIDYGFFLLAVQALDLLRAVAIALFVVFLALGFLAARRRVPVAAAMIGISVLFLLLVRLNLFDPGTRWVFAALLTGAGAIMMTTRLLHAPEQPDRNAQGPARGPAQGPWGPGHFRPAPPNSGPGD
jgi:hypothetical protein